MGLPWVRLDTGWATNAKIAPMVGEGLRGRSAAYAYIAGLCYTGDQGLDGFIPRFALNLLQITKGDVDKLIEYGLWHVDGDGGWRVNDWTDYQQSNDETKKRSERARQAAQRRWSKNAASNA